MRQLLHCHLLLIRANLGDAKIFSNSPIRTLYALLLSIALSCSAWAREVDNYLAWGVDIEDSGPQLDQYMRQRMADALKVVNEDKSIYVVEGKPPQGRNEKVQEKYFSCTLSAVKLMRAAFFNPTYQQIESYLDNDPAIDRYPRRPGSRDPALRSSQGELPADGYMSNREYLNTSIIGTSPFNVPLSRVVNVHGIYTGADKFGHFTSFGPRYLMKFRNQVLDGASFDEAFQGVLEFGYRSERNIVGMTFTGVFSRGDLEANYQGMEFIYSLCQSTSPVRLHFNGQYWELLNLDRFTMKTWVNPEWDESYNTSIYSEAKWRKHVTPGFERGNYCQQLASPWVQAQKHRYAQYVDTSLNQQLEDQWLPLHFPDFDPREHSLDYFCAAQPQGAPIARAP